MLRFAKEGRGLARAMNRRMVPMRPYFFLILLVLILGLAVDQAALDAWRAKAASATATPLVAQVGSAPALACIIGRVPQPAERFAPDPSPRVGPNSIALLGLVLDEAPLGVPRVPVTPIFLSQVQTVLPLSGEGITPVVRIGPNGFGAPDCSGGPRLFAGEKVLLFLHPARGLLDAPADNQHGDWQSGQGGTPILFEGDAAYYLSWVRYADHPDSNGQERRSYVGKTEDVLRLALTYFNATPDERALAFQFVLGTTAGAQIMPPKTGDGGLAWPSSSNLGGDQ
jgi:hypothetical protein